MVRIYVPQPVSGFQFALAFGLQLLEGSQKYSYALTYHRMPYQSCLYHPLARNLFCDSLAT